MRETTTICAPWNVRDYDGDEYSVYQYPANHLAEVRRQAVRFRTILEMSGARLTRSFCPPAGSIRGPLPTIEKYVSLERRGGYLPGGDMDSSINKDGSLFSGEPSLLWGNLLIIQIVFMQPYGNVPLHSIHPRLLLWSSQIPGSEFSDTKGEYAQDGFWHPQYSFREPGQYSPSNCHGLYEGFCRRCIFQININ